VLDEFDEWYVSMQEEADVRIGRLVQANAVGADFKLHWRAYGRDGTLGDRERETGVGHEVMIAVKTIAPTQSDANGIASLAWHTLIHHPSPGTKGFPTLAFPFSPNVIERGPAYRFNVNHIIAPVDDPLEFVRIEIG